MLNNTNLLQSALDGDKKWICRHRKTVALWEIWSPLLAEINPQLQLYTEDTIELLHYKRFGSGLHFSNFLQSLSGEDLSSFQVLQDESDEGIRILHSCE